MKYRHWYFRIDITRQELRICQRNWEEEKMCNKLDEPYTQVLSNNFDEGLKQYFRGYDSRKSTSEPTSLGDILKYYNTIFV